MLFFFFFKQKTEYEMRISDWSSDVCSSDLITLDWLKEHLDGDFSVADVVATLNRIGHEVEGVENPAEKLAGFRVAKVLTAEKHPQADKLQVLTVDTGDGAESGRAHVRTPVTNAHLVCRLPLETYKETMLNTHHNISNP